MIGINRSNYEILFDTLVGTVVFLCFPKHHGALKEDAEG